jgi:zinc/manganese transport system permease protein
MDLLLLPLLACLVLTGIHAYLGIHILARGVIFVDLALAQIAALGSTMAFLLGHPLQSEAAYWYALAFAAAGAVLLSITRPRTERIPHEAIIGIVYVASAAAAVLAVDRAPQGAEYIKAMLVGNILTVSEGTLSRTAALYGGIGVLHWVLRRRFLQISLDPDGAAREGRWVRAWDLIFYLSFGVVVTSSVRMAGVLLVFAFLVIPAASAALFARAVWARLVLGWILGTIASLAGLAGSFAWNLPTGAAVVCAFVLVLCLAAGVQTLAPARLAGLGMRRLALGASLGASLLVAAAGGFLAAFPAADHLWLDGLERAVPAVRNAFLRPRERQDFDDALQDIARFSQEIGLLQGRKDAARWGDAALPEEMLRRIELTMASHQENIAGDRAVVRILRGRIRARQRYVLGIPLFLGGATVAGLCYLRLRKTRRAVPATGLADPLPPTPTHR